MGVYIEDNILVKREPKNFHFNFDLPKKVHQNLRHEIEFTIKRNGSFDQLLYKYEHGHDIHQHRKQRNKSTTQICF